MPLSEKASVIVIDGPAGVGKSTVAREIARRLGLPFLDTGAIYRAVTLAMLRDNIPPLDSPKLRGRLREFAVSFSGVKVFAGGEDVTDEIRTPRIDASVSSYSALPVVRESLLEIQKTQGTNGLVAEGRDMGTVVFPGADLKIYLIASPEERARRRCEERIAKGNQADYDEILRQVRARDKIDSTRAIAPLKPAEDAIIVDTTELSFEDVTERVMDCAARAGIGKRHD
ncbi:MAG: (d)CMP kinase [Synergistaceae bacterium]|jgi:cytidylate kinase|nr:(d)CMP kinase [Synergistaceae bacterium]